jgi:hypothetical protein
MTYNEVAHSFLKIEKRKIINGEERIVLIAPEKEEDILAYLLALSKVENPDIVNIFEYSSNNSFSIIWIYETGTIADFLRYDYTNTAV